IGGVPVSSTSAGQSGDFRFRNVAPGNYEIVVDREGFKSAVTRVRVGNQPPRPLTITLTLADVRQEITVGVEPGQVNATTSENLDAVTLERSTLDNLPIFDQDYIATMSRFLDSSSMGTNGVTVVVDGVETTRAGVSASAIQEVKINQDPY